MYISCESDLHKDSFKTLRDPCPRTSGGLKAFWQSMLVHPHHSHRPTRAKHLPLAPDSFAVQPVLACLSEVSDTWRDMHNAICI